MASREGVSRHLLGRSAAVCQEARSVAMLHLAPGQREAVTHGVPSQWEEEFWGRLLAEDSATSQCQRRAYHDASVQSRRRCARRPAVTSRREIG